MARCEQPLTERRRRRPWMPPACISASASPSTAPAILHAPELVKLPLWEMHDGRKHCYVVEGTKIGTRVAMEDGEFGGAEGPLKSAKRLPQKLRNRLQRLERSFWPDPKLVTPDYYIYCKWRFIQRIAASAISVIATQQMLFAVGLGAKRTLPTAAALNWVMKDGLGRLGKLSVATNFGREFDADLKRFRFTSSVVFNMSAAVETLTPLFPNQFLLLATAANIGKSIGITTANVVRAPIQRSFALGENLADISARTSAQQVLADNLGLALAVGLTFVCRNAPRARSLLPYALFPFLCTVDLACIHKELKAVQLKTLNKERAEMVVGKWLDSGQIPSFADVANEECILIPASLDEGSLPLQIRPLHHVVQTVDELSGVLASSSRVLGQPSKYVLTYRSAEPKMGVKKVLSKAQRYVAKRVYGIRKSRIRGRAVVAVHSDAKTQDILCALLQAAHLRRLPFRADLTAQQARTWAMEESLRRAVCDLQNFMRAASDSGWLTNSILLSSAERATFHVEGGMQVLFQACLDCVNDSTDDIK